MVAFPQYAWDGWLDLHGQQAHVSRHEAAYATGYVLVEGEPGTEIEAGTVFCVPAEDGNLVIEYTADSSSSISEDGSVTVAVTAVEAGPGSNAKAGSVSVMDEPLDGITKVSNPEPVTGGTARESDDSYYDRIAAEYENSMTYLGNDSDYKRWAQEAGAGDCIVDPAANGPGTVKLVLVDANGQPASDALAQAVYDYIVSPSDRTKRLLPTACAELSCVPAVTVKINYSCTGLQCDGTTTAAQVAKDFKEALKDVYAKAKPDGVLRYNDVRPVISSIAGVQDFNTFLVNGGISNIYFKSEEYPETGICEFSQEGVSV
ncbi:MAG: baseplate J/gp47 family protein [Lachnospiraceae bacterium]